MTITRKRRWIVATVAIFVLASVAGGLAVSRADGEEDVPSLGFVHVERLEDGREAVVFRLQAPEVEAILYGNPRVFNPATRLEHQPPHPLTGFPMSIEHLPKSGMILRKGELRELWFIRPDDEVWRLRLDVSPQGLSPKGFVGKVDYYWEKKSLAPLQQIMVFDFSGLLTIESDPITNAVAEVSY